MEEDIATSNPQQEVPGNDIDDPGTIELITEDGTEICATVENCRIALITLGRLGANELTPTSVARIMIGMIEGPSRDKDSSSGGLWNVKVFSQAVLEVVPSMVWKEVFNKLDFLGFCIKDGTAFRSLMEALKHGLQLQGQGRTDQFPIDTFYRRWINTEGQLSLLRACLDPGNGEIFSFCDYLFQSVATDMLETSEDKTCGREIAVWKSMELLELLLSLSDGGDYPGVQEIFKFPIAHCPDILLLGLIQTSSPMNMLRQELIGALLPVFFGNHINSKVILRYAWQNSLSSNDIKPIMIHAMAEWYLRGGDYDQTKLSRILEMAQDLDALDLLLKANSHVFIIDLASLAASREGEILNLDKWLSDNIRDHGDNFVESILKVLKRRVSYTCGKEKEESIAELPCEAKSTDTMIQCLNQYIGNVNNLNKELSCNIVEMSCAYDKMIENKNPVRAIGDPQQTQPPGFLGPPQHRNYLEAASGQLFQSQNENDPLPSLGSALGELNLSENLSRRAGSFWFDSSNSIEPTPMVSSELRELQIDSSTGSPNMSASDARMVGVSCTPMGRLNERLESNPLEEPAVKPSEEAAIDSGSGSGDNAIKSKLTDDVLLFSNIPREISKEGKNEGNKHSYRICSKPLNTNMTIPTKTSATAEAVVIFSPESASSVVPGPSEPFIIGGPSIANATNKTKLRADTATAKKDEKITLPPEEIQSKTAFIFNNLNQMNLEHLCEELREIIIVEYWPWLAQYLVVKRASNELNLHILYSNLLDNLNAADLNSYVLWETHWNIRILLKDDNSAGNISNRTLLKNLGHWLGMITVLKNKSIVLDDLDIKSLIIESYRKGLQDLLYVVPFVAKIMESCTQSRVFSPPCPWTMSILNVLAELHQEPYTTLNLKFEIEVLCKELNIELRELKPHGILKDEMAFKIEVYQLSYSSEKPQGQQQKHSIPNPGQQQEVQLQCPSESNTGVMKMKSSVAQSALVKHVVSKPLEHLEESMPQTVLTGLSSTPTLSTNVLEPKFSYRDIDTSNLTAFLNKNVSIDPQLPLFQTHPELIKCVGQSIEEGILCLLHQVVDQSIQVTINACEQIIKNDFALDPEESRIRCSAHDMMRYMTAGTAITYKHYMFYGISANLKNVFMTQSKCPRSNQLNDMMEEAVVVVTNDNLELACVFIQKAAAEKALIEIDKKLAPEYDARKQAKLEDRIYFDPTRNYYQTERILQSIRVKPVSSSDPFSQQLPVYENFSRTIPGFVSLCGGDGESLFLGTRWPQCPVISPAGHLATGGAAPVVTPPPNPPSLTKELLYIYEKLISEMENYLRRLPATNSSASPQLGQGFKNLLEIIVVARQSNSVMAAIILVQKVVEGLLEGPASAPFPSDTEIFRYRDLHLMVLKGLQDDNGFGQPWVNWQVTKCLIESVPDGKYNVEGYNTLIQANLVNMIQFDAHLSNAIDKGRNFMAVNFAMQLLRDQLYSERESTAEVCVTDSNDLYHTIDMLSRIANSNRLHSPEGLVHLLENLRNRNTVSAICYEPPPVDSMTLQTAVVGQNSEFGDLQDHQSYNGFGSSGLITKSENLFKKWFHLYHKGCYRDSNKEFTFFINDLYELEILKSDDVLTEFFRVCVQFCVSQVYQGLESAKATTNGDPMPGVVRQKCYHNVDALVRLVSLLIRHFGDTVGPKVNLLNKFLGIVAGLLIQDNELQQGKFQQLPFHRLIIILFQDLNPTDSIFGPFETKIFVSFCNILHILNPEKVPGFAYAWLEIIGNRHFITRMLALSPDQKCLEMYCQLLVDLFKFLQPFLQNVNLASPVKTLYQGTLRLILLILHDVPDVLCDYCYNFLDCIPSNCIQLSNLILSAFPRNMRLPDPFTDKFHFEMLADTCMSPRVMLNVAVMIQPAKFKKDLDSYLQFRAPVTFLSELRSNLQIMNEVGTVGTRYNIPLLNAVVLFVGSQHIRAIQDQGQTLSLSTIAHTSYMDIFQNLVVDLDTNGRYLFLNALANQLRFPSSHTHYFGLVILYLFAQSNTEVIQEQIACRLVERLLVNRPHPWGLLVTFVELIKNPIYKFWQYEFVHCNPQMETLFESVARSCRVTTNTCPPGFFEATVNLSTLEEQMSASGCEIMKIN